MFFLCRFSPGDTNMVLREFEKCGEILKHVPGPRDANWMHILYQVSNLLLAWIYWLILFIKQELHFVSGHNSVFLNLAILLLKVIFLLFGNQLVVCLLHHLTNLLLIQNRSDAHKALNKNGMQINGVLIVGVKLLDPMQRQALNERLKNQGFMPLPLPSARNSEVSSLKAPSRPYYLQNGNSTARQTGGTIASPTKSLVSKIMDLMFGV